MKFLFEQYNIEGSESDEWKQKKRFWCCYGAMHFGNHVQEYLEKATKEIFIPVGTCCHRLLNYSLSIERRGYC